MLTIETIERIKALAAARGPLLVASDLDGTLAPIVANSAEARVPPGTLAVLDRLAQRAKVAVITGRDLNTARRMVPVEGVDVVGSHGLEASFDDPLIPGVNRAALSSALEQVEQQVITAVPSSFLHIERKAVSTAFHYRRAPDLEQSLRAALATLPPGLRLREGRMVLEVLPDANAGKGVALGALIARYRAKSALVMGDDLTDVAMFEAALKAAQRDGLHLLLVGVSGGRETPPRILELADVVVDAPGEALEVLETLARALGV
ncbi:trehalose-phosphatase [Tepidiforma sp.]|uniref:trehalose-phosphatase n=1 Tax=Tepidiforma sp. TaxID=2682230 RepID=UPI002ADDB257|nr:trehalose-phosphatase [Tepidiforma sp.]